MTIYIRNREASGTAPPVDPFVAAALDAGCAVHLSAICEIISGATCPFSLNHALDGMALPKATAPQRRYPFPDMRVGDHFVIPLGIDQKKLSAAARTYSHGRGIRYRLRNGRCWRVS